MRRANSVFCQRCRRCEAKTRTRICVIPASDDFKVRDVSRKGDIKTDRILVGGLSVLLK